MPCFPVFLSKRFEKVLGSQQKNAASLGYLCGSVTVLVPILFLRPYFFEAWIIGALFWYWFLGLNLFILGSSLFHLSRH